MREIGSSVRFLRDKFVPLYSERGYSDKDIRNKEVLALFSCGFVPFLSRQNFVSWCKILQVADLKRLVRMIKGRISLTTSNHQNSYLMFNERDLPQFALVTIYLQLPHYEFPTMLKGLYLCLDYNHNPIARRIVLVKQSDSTDIRTFLEMESKLVPKAELTPELEAYYNYTCREGDYIKTCTVPSPKLDETDLEREKKMLTI